VLAVPKSIARSDDHMPNNRDSIEIQNP
jgi:hypothetical protein